ncbi:MAG: hypothetical protein BWY49_01016 [Candidatus Omnitrophica bacterium ADurb.Bin314]|nr:MAG: hypothetical protein BWY49_01016 [Candidatus Omnitrophica bacterium ADurb.Bin314]
MAGIKVLKKSNWASISSIESEVSAVRSIDSPNGKAKARMALAPIASMTSALSIFENSSIVAVSKIVEPRWSMELR